MDKKQGSDWRDYISDEKVLKSFTTDVETVGNIKMFMEQYGIQDQSKTINHLVKLGLACLGYNEKEDVLKKIRVNDQNNVGDLFQHKKTSNEQTFNAISFQQPKESIEERISDIILHICKHSKNGYAAREAIISEGENQLISAVTIAGTIDTLKRNGKIYEPVVNQYRLKHD